MDIHRITATVRGNEYLSHLAKVISNRPSTLQLSVQVGCDFEFTLETDAGRTVLTLPDAAFEFHVKHNELGIVCLDQTDDVLIDGYSLADAVQYHDKPDDEYHYDPEYARVVDRARLLHLNMQAVMDKARARTDFLNTYLFSNAQLLASLDTALRMCRV